MNNKDLRERKARKVYCLIVEVKPREEESKRTAVGDGQ
jgi:hypothetical protein